jgi:hypothetical protein
MMLGCNFCHLDGQLLPRFDRSSCKAGFFARDQPMDRDAFKYALLPFSRAKDESVMLPGSCCDLG